MKDYEQFVPTPDPLIEAKLEIAAVRAGEWVFDLGCGDGRVLISAAKNFRAQCTGVDVRQDLLDIAREELALNGLEERIELVHQDFMKTDVSSADVVILYLNRGTLGPLAWKLNDELKAGARVVTHTFDLPGWTAAETVEVPVEGQNTPVFLYKKA